MFKKYNYLLLTTLLFTALVIALPALAEEPSETTTEELTTADLKQVESTTKMNFIGQLLEVGSTDLPTTLIVRTKDGDEVVEISAKTVLGERRDMVTRLGEWIPGDSLRVVGEKNDNTGAVEASLVVNRSIKVKYHWGLNGWITAVNKEAGTFDVQWQNKNYTFHYSDDTRFVVAPKINAAIDDIQIGDRVRGRYIERRGEIPHASIVVVLRRGADLRMKVRTWKFNAELTEISSTEVPTDIKVKLLRIAGRSGDVNILLREGDERIVHIKEKTKIVRRFMGKTDLSEFLPGDHLVVVGRLNDDGTIDAKVLKNNSIWKSSTRGIAGEITSIDAAARNFTFVWKNQTWTVDVPETARVIKDGNKNATLEDLAVGDKVRGRGVLRPRNKTVTAYLIVTVKSSAELPASASMEEGI